MRKPKTLIHAAHSDDPCTILGIIREIMRHHNLYVNYFSNGDSNFDIMEGELLRVKQGIECLNILAQESNIGMRMSLGENVFAFNASEKGFVDAFVFGNNTLKLENIVREYTTFVLESLNQQKPDFVLVPNYDGSNQTHDFVHLVVREIMKGIDSKVKLFSFPGYPIRELPAQVTDIYKNWTVGRFPQFEPLGLHKNGYSPIDFPSGLLDGFYEIPKDEFNIFLKAIEAFKSQKLQGFFDCFPDPRYHEILRVDMSKLTEDYMWKGYHVDVGFATYQFHLQNKYPWRLADLSVVSFIKAMEPVLRTVRETVEVYSQRRGLLYPIPSSKA